MGLNDLPDELLLKIFASMESTRNVSLVSRRFHRILCEFEKTLFVGKKARHEYYSSIWKSERKISKIIIRFDNVNDEIALQIVRKFGKTLRDLHLMGNVTVHDLFQVLSLAPKILHLHVSDVSIVDSVDSSDHYRNGLQSFRLPSTVNTLEFNQCGDELLKVLNELPAGVLTDLRLKNSFDLRHLTLAFQRQPNIKSLKFYQSDFINGDEERFVGQRICDSMADILAPLTLEHFVYSSSMLVNDIATVFSRQTKLKSLDWDAGYNTQDILPHIRHLHELENLSISLRHTPSIIYVERLINLKHLTLTDIRWHHFDAFTGMDNSRITSLVISTKISSSGVYTSFLTIDRIKALARSVPNLENLDLSVLSNRECVFAVLTNFNFIKTLKMYGNIDMNIDKHFGANILNRILSYLYQSDSVNPKLTKLAFIFAYEYNSSFLQTIIDNYPNLKQLTTTADSSLFRQIVDGFKELEVLKIADASGLNADDIHHLRITKNKLKFLALFQVSLVSYDIVVGQRKTLRTMFNVVENDKVHLIMASDRETLKQFNDIPSWEGRNHHHLRRL